MVELQQVKATLKENITSIIPGKQKVIDWKCYAGDIRRQGECQACYAFAVADSISSMLRIYNSPKYIPL